MKAPETLTHQKSNVSVLLQAEKSPISPKLNALKILLDPQLVGNQDSVISPMDYSLSRQVSYNKGEFASNDTKGLDKLKAALTPTMSRFEGNRDIRKLKLNDGVDPAVQIGRELLGLKKGESTVTSSRLIRNISQLAQKKMESSPMNAILIPEKNRSSILQKDRPSYSYLRNHLTFIPDNLSCVSDRNDKNKSPFCSFDELARTTTNRYPKMLENLLLAHENDSKTSKASIDSQDDRLDNIKSMLRFNKLQKNHYENQTSSSQPSLFNPGATFSNLKAAAAKPVSSKVSVMKVSRPKRLKAITFAGSESEENSPRHNPKEEKEKKSKLGGYFYNDSIKEGSHQHRITTNNTPPLHNHYGSNWKLYWHIASRESGAWKPDAGEGHSITAIGDVLVTYGGIGNKITNIIATYNPAKDVWTKIEARGDIPLRGRHGHTACQFEGNMVIFGGELKFNEELKFRECSNDMYIFSLERKQWKYNKAEGGKIIDPRRNHTAAIYNRHMYVYGGVDIEGKFLKDVWSFNFKSNHWKLVKAEGNKEFGQAFHAMSACFNQKSAHTEPQVTEPGLYVFGGKDDDGIILDSLKVLKVQGNTSEWKYPITKGPYPPARYGHAMVFNETANVLIIHGGRNDNLYQMNQDICLNDFRILNLLEMKWSVAASYGDPCPSGRWHHSMTMYRSAIVIFGGLGFNTYLSPEMKFIETDQYIVRKLIKEQKNKKDISFAERLSKTVIVQKDDFGPSVLKATTPQNDPSRLLNFKSYKPIPTQDDLDGDIPRKSVFRNKLKNLMLKSGFSGESPVRSLTKDLQIPSLHINLKTIE